MSYKKFKTIGILGGIGPSASASMYSRIIKYMQNEFQAWDDGDFPPIMVYSTALEGFDEKGIADPGLAKDALVHGVQKLEHMGSDLVVIACNTVHHFDKEIQAAIQVPLVHMVEEACKDVKKQGYAKVAVACSQSTRDLELYTKSLKSLGLEPIVTTQKEQAVINNAIMEVMGGQQGSQTIFNLNTVFHAFKDRGAESVILGCTELPLAITQNDTDIKIFDANDIAVKEAVRLASN